MTTPGGEQTWGGSDILASCLEEGVAIQIGPNIASLDALEGAHLVRRCQFIMSSDVITIIHQNHLYLDPV